jgi:ATP-dependent DNA helicase RecG
MIEEQFDPDRIILTLEFSKKQDKKASEKKRRKKH